jgi:uncharacterized DUF497 family protein
MEICWDPDKARSNLKKHGISFSEVEELFMDPLAISLEDPDAVKEQRFVVIGMDSNKRVVTAVYMYWNDMVRLISARRASKTEIRAYERRIRFQ